MPQQLCEVGKNSYYWLCGKPASTLVTTGCVHEHIFVTLVCDSCLAQEREGNEMLCSHCYTSGAPNTRAHIVRTEPIPAHQDTAESGSAAV